MEQVKEPKIPSLGLSILVFLAVAVMIAAAVLVWETDIHIVLIFGALLAGEIFCSFAIKVFTVIPL